MRFKFYVSIFVFLLYFSSVNSKKSLFLDNLVKDVWINEQNSSFSKEILNQKYILLGQGEQSIAFLSEDKKYVLKFFLKNSVKKSRKYYWRIFKGFFKNFRYKYTKQIFQNYSNAFFKLQKNTAIIGIHLGGNDSDLPVIHMQDLEGNNYSVDLNFYPFVVQKKVEVFSEILKKEISLQQKQQYLIALKKYLIYRCEEGFYDRNKALSLKRNFGFVDDIPVQFDLGSLIFSPKIKNNAEKEKILAKFSKWALKREDIKPLLCIDTK